MPDPLCRLCAAPSRDAPVCTRCADGTARALQEAAELWGALQDAVARQTRLGGGGPRTGRPAPAAPVRPGGDPAADQQAGWPGGLPVDLAAAEVADVVRNTVATWARVVVDEVGADPPTSTVGLLRWLAGRCGWLAGQEFGGDAIDELRDAGRLVGRAVDRPADRRYYGPCACGADLYGLPSAAMLTCGCGERTDAAERARWLAQQVRDRSYTAAEIEAAYGIRADRIRQWATRGRITQRGHDRRGRPLYALPEVLALDKRGSRAKV